jgi:hypothetical protein
LLATVPTTGDIGLTWDEPSYRTSQVISAQWWEALSRARSLADLRALVEPDALLVYWPYARSGYNFHPPLAGQLDLLTHALFGYAGLRRSLELVEEIGVEAIGAHDLSLADRFRAGLATLGHEPLPAPGSAIVSVPGLGHRQPGLAAAGIQVSDRAGNLRAAFHLYNTAADVDRLLEVLAG